MERKPLEYEVGEQHCTELHCSSADDWMQRFANSAIAPCGRYGTMMRAFAETVRGEMENPYTLDYELTLYRLILNACVRS